MASSEQNTVQQSQVTGSSLRVRQETYERYSVPQVDFPAWVLDRVTWRGDERVLDVGCGPGTYYGPLKSKVPDVHYFGMDTSTAMLEQHPARDCVTRADAHTLPFPDGSFDVVMANHVLFHVADRDQAIAEFRRVLKQDGMVLAATNSLHTMPEFQALMRRGLVLLSSHGKGQMQPPPLPHHTFALENGTRQLAQQFFAVVRYDLPSSLIFPTLEPVMAFLESTRELREPYLPAEVAWDDLMMVMRDQIVTLINHFGELAITKLSGVLIASDRGGFIHDYVGRQDGASADGHA